MKPIREQLREQAEAIREAWAKGDTGGPLFREIRLDYECPFMPASVIRNNLGRLNVDSVCDIRPGHLMLREGRTEMRGGTYSQRITVILAYREVPWLDGTPIVGDNPFISFNSLLDALEPPCASPPKAPDEPSTGSWRDRPSLL